MFMVKLIKYVADRHGNAPVEIADISLREAQAIHVRHEADLRKVVQLGDAPGETMEFTVGDRPDCSYNVAYVMNAQGKTVETIR